MKQSSVSKDVDVVIVVPGLFGSKLIYQDQKTAFPTTTQVLFGAVSDSVSTILQLPLAKNGIQESDGIFAAPLTYRGFFNLDRLYLHYSGFYSKMRESSVLEIFNYDWRRDPLETASSLQKFIEYIIVKYPHSNVKVLCHSLGCRIGFKAIMDLNSEAKSHIKGVVYVTGFFGTSNCGDMIKMLKDGLSFTPMCTFHADTVRSWPLFYHLILGKRDYTCLVGRLHLPLDLTQVDAWEKLLATKFNEEQKEHVKWVIAQAMKFNEWYDNVDSRDHPKCVAVIGSSVQKRYVDFRANTLRTKISFEEGEEKAGDGTIWTADQIPKCECRIHELTEGISHAFAVSLANIDQLSACLRELDGCDSDARKLSPRDKKLVRSGEVLLGTLNDFVSF